VNPKECEELCVSSDNCDIWSWRLLPDGLRLCGTFNIISDQVPDDERIKLFEPAPNGTLSVSRWRYPCNIIPLPDVRDHYFVENIDPALLNSPAFPPNYSKGSSNLNDTGNDDEINGILWQTFEHELLKTILNEEKFHSMNPDFFIRNGVKILANNDVPQQNQVMKSPVECEWHCIHVMKKDSCVAYSWSTDDSISGLCCMYQMCPNEDDFAWGDVELLAREVTNQNPDAINLGSDFIKFEGSVTGVYTSKCSFPTKFLHNEHGFWSWWVIMLIVLGVAIIVIIVVISTSRRAKKR